MAVNYSRELDKILENPQNRGKKLFLHSCCAPCSSYVLEYLRSYFRITVFYYNPNITEDEEYRKRAGEQKRLIGEMNRELSGGAFSIEIMEGDYDREIFFESARGLESCREGGERCAACFELRLRETALWAGRQNADYFTTTLTISPLKNAARINEIGERLAAEYGIAFLPSDFKKKDGYKRSIRLSAEYGLYRQDYCGCVFSREQREREKRELQQRKSCEKQNIMIG